MDLSRPPAPEDGEEEASTPGAARLTAPLARKLAGATQRLRRIAQPQTFRHRGWSDDDAASHESLREAFRSASPVEPARFPSRPTSGAGSIAEMPVASGADALEVPVTLAPAPPDPPDRSAAPNPPDGLVQAPTNVATTADDFFGGLVRRGERRP